MVSEYLKSSGVGGGGEGALLGVNFCWVMDNWLFENWLWTTLSQTLERTGKSEIGLSLLACSWSPSLRWVSLQLLEYPNLVLC